MSLKYDISYHLHCKITLDSNIEIIADSLEQWRTYSGLIEGIPTKLINDRIILSAVAKASKQCVNGGKPNLIDPLRRDFLRTPGDMKGISLGRNSAEWLPRVCCIGQFRDTRPAELTLVWFQDEFAFPIADQPLAAIRALNWMSASTEFEW